MPLLPGHFPSRKGDVLRLSVIFVIPFNPALCSFMDFFPAQEPNQTELSIYDESVDENSTEFKNLEEVSPSARGHFCSCGRKVEIRSRGWDWLDGKSPVPLPGNLLATITL